jgi:hypothetical protein
MRKEMMIVALAAGLMAGCATNELRTAELRDLPFDVQQTIIEQAPNADIARVERKTEGDRIVYDVFFHEPHKYPELHIAADGTLLENGRPMIMRERAGATLLVPTVIAPVRVESSELPAEVLNAIRTHAPNAKVIDVDKEVRSETVYEIQFAEPGGSRTLRITEDGRLIND